jgi:hypothetical protein
MGTDKKTKHKRPCHLCKSVSSVVKCLLFFTSTKRPCHPWSDFSGAVWTATAFVDQTAAFFDSQRVLSC